MPELFTITQEWADYSHYSTGGTRAKKYLQSPEGMFYFFKRSQVKPGKDYRYEFWSEVIAFELGTMLGFPMLRYDVAIHEDVMGCISQSMINSEHEELVEGVKYLQAFAPSYNPTLKDHQKRYTFDLIINSLKRAGLAHHLPMLVEVIIFDALIGNGDRHQENWAFISTHVPIHEAIEEMEHTGELDKQTRVTRWIMRWLKKNVEWLYKKQKERGLKMNSNLYVPTLRMAPIYDSGSSLGRELTEERVTQLLSSEEELTRYIEKGKAEIHWNNEKVDHFTLVYQLLQTEYGNYVRQTIRRMLQRWNTAAIEQMIQQTDLLVPESHIMYKIPEERKRLIAKILHLRRNRLEQLIS